MSVDTDAGDTRDDPPDPPRAHDLAAELGVEPRRLVRFVDNHPDPEPVNVLGWAVADPALKDEVAAYLDARERDKRERREKHREVRREERRGDL